MTYRVDVARDHKWRPMRQEDSLEHAIELARCLGCARVVREDGLEVFFKGRSSVARLVSFDGERIQ